MKAFLHKHWKFLLCAGLLLIVTFLVKKRKSKPGAKNRTEK